MNWVIDRLLGTGPPSLLRALIVAALIFGICAGIMGIASVWLTP